MRQSALFNFGQLGVQLFFIASALTLCLSMKERNEKSIYNFYIRRFFRIAPLYYFGIVLYFLWRVFKNYCELGTVNIPPEYNLIGILENVFFIHGFHLRNFNFVVPGGWSIATEMCFYLIFPLLFSLQSKLNFKKFLLFSSIVALITFLFQFIGINVLQPYMLQRGMIHSMQTNDEFGFIYCSIINQINIFLVGIMTYQKLKTNAVPRLQICLAIGLCVISCYLLNTTTFKTGYNGFLYPILASIAFGIFSIKIAEKERIEGIFGRYLMSFGRLSFSMYILHFLFVDILTRFYSEYIFKYFEFPELKLTILYASIVSVSYVASKLSNAVIEKPGIRLGKIFIKTIN